MFPYVFSTTCAHLGTWYILIKVNEFEELKKQRKTAIHHVLQFAVLLQVLNVCKYDPFCLALKDSFCQTIFFLDFHAVTVSCFWIFIVAVEEYNMIAC